MRKCPVVRNRHRLRVVVASTVSPRTPATSMKRSQDPKVKIKLLGLSLRGRVNLVARHFSQTVMRNQGVRVRGQVAKHRGQAVRVRDQMLNQGTRRQHLKERGSTGKKQGRTERRLVMKGSLTEETSCLSTSIGLSTRCQVSVAETLAIRRQGSDYFQ